MRRAATQTSHALGTVVDLHAVALVGSEPCCGTYLSSYYSYFQW